MNTRPAAVTLFAVLCLCLLRSAHSATPILRGEPAETSWPRPCLLARELAGAPRIDGTAAGEMWRGLESQALRFPLNAHEPSRSDTTFRIGYDDEALHLLIELSPAEGGRVFSKERKRDSRFWSDDGGEILIAPLDDPGDARQFLFNLSGARMDFRTRHDPATGKRGSHQLRWNPRWETKLLRKGGSVCLACAIPFSELGVSNTRGSAFRFNIARRLRGHESRVMSGRRHGFTIEIGAIPSSRGWWFLEGRSLKRVRPNSCRRRTRWGSYSRKAGCR